MHIIEIVLDGFKSYAKRTVISGFDPEFNAITGLNGSGKSNILDSICFVLGISNLTQVRAQNLNELIYKQGQAGVTKASVTLVFDNSNPEMSPLGYEQLSQITVTRQIAIGGRNKYMINGHSAQLQRVQNLFHSVQLNVNNPHFLIMQGRITKVLNMKPIEILGMIEEAAGTRMFETKKRKAVETIEKKETKLVEITRVMEEDITPRLEKLSTQRAQYLEFTSLSTEVESTGRIVQAYEYVCAEQAQAKCAESQVADQEMRKTVGAQLADAEKEEGELKKKLSETLAKKEKESAGELRKREEAEQELSKQLVKLSAEHTQLRKAHEADASAAEATEAEMKKSTGAQAKAQAELDKAAAAAAKAGEAAAAAKAAADEKQSQYEAAMGVGASNGEGAKNLQAQLSDAASEATACETAGKTAEMRKKQFAKELKEVEKKLAEARKSGGKHEKEHASLSAEVAALREQIGALGYDEASDAETSKLLAEKQKAVAVAAKKEREVASQMGGGLDFKYADPSKNFDRRKVKGTVAANLVVKDAANNTALEALAGGRLYQVIVDDEETGMQLLTKGQLSRRVTLIPLSKIRPSVLPADKVSAAKKLVGASKAFLACELLEFDKEVAPAIQHVFGSALVCADKDAARAICDKLSLKTVTLEGDLYDPMGTLTGGSRPKGGASLLQRAGEVRELRATLSAREAEVAELSAKLEACREHGEAYNQLQSALELKQHELQIRAETMRSSPVGQLAASLEALQQQMKDGEAAAAEAKAGLAKATETKKALEAQIKDFEGNREEKMAQAKKAIAEAGKEVKAKEKSLQTAQAAEQKAKVGVDELAKELAAAAEQRDELAKRQEQTVAEIEAKAAAEQKKRAEYEAAAAALAKCQEALGSYDDAVAEITARRDELEKLRGDGQVELTKIEQRCARYEKELSAAEATCKELLRRHPWMVQEKASFGVPGSEYDFAKKKPAALQKELAKKASTLEALSKKINKKVLTMLETAEQEYADLMSKKEIVEKDKEKIGAVISELAQKKIEALQKTWAKVNADFGSIFSTLLPGARAKLEPQEGCPVEEGLIVKVGFGAIGGTSCVWKQSLQELSGGQRSLIALSLVLSLLRFKPAPVYILDEVDAALDLSHTQNIGKMIKAHFKQSQFLVVSLKEGMFNNANVIFRTKFVDNVSCVTRTVPNGAAAAAAAEGENEAAAPAAAAGKGKAAGKGRAALSAKNAQVAA